MDFSSGSLHAAEEAAMLATKFNSELHLLHVTLHPTLSYLLAPEVYMVHLAGDEKELSKNDNQQLIKLKRFIDHHYGITTIPHAAKGNFKTVIKKIIAKEKIDLVVMGVKRKSGIHEFFFGNAAETVIDIVDCEVLCVYPESDCSKMKKIVIPIENFIPKKKIRLAYKLARKFAANIHLITLNKNFSGVTGNNAKMLMAAYQYIKDMTSLPVECKTVEGNNLAKAAVSYAKKIGADLIMVNPGTESQIQGPVLRKRSSDIVNYSSIPVLSVQPLAEY